MFLTYFQSILKKSKKRLSEVQRRIESSSSSLLEDGLNSVKDLYTRHVLRRTSVEDLYALQIYALSFASFGMLGRQCARII